MAAADFPDESGTSRNKRACFRCAHAGSTHGRVVREQDFSALGRLISRREPPIRFLFVMSQL